MIIKLLLFIESVKVKSIMILLVRDFLYKSVYHALVTAITLNNISYLEGAFQYYHHATPGEHLQGSPGVAW